MDRQPNIRQQFGWFHITNLGVDHVDIFDTPLDHLVFEHEVQVAARRFEIEIHAYCWMDNHFAAMTSSLRQFTERSHPTDRTPHAGRRHRPFHIEDVLAAVAAETGVAIDDLSVARPGETQLPRVLVAALVDRLRPHTTSELADVFGVGSRRSVQRLIAKGRALIGSDPEFSASADRVMARLWRTSNTWNRAA